METERLQENRLATMAYLVKHYKDASRQEGHLGKTVLLKSMFILQDLFKLPLDYKYSIYLYGPYASEAVQDLESASLNDYFDMQISTDSAYNNFYDLTIPKDDEKVKGLLNGNKEFLDRYKNEFSTFLETFKDKKTKDFELLSTIIFLYNRRINYSTVDEILGDVGKIKPHFTETQIKSAYEKLKGLLEKPA